MSKEKKALVVGGSGFIGSHVADHLSELAGFRCWNCWDAAT